MVFVVFLLTGITNNLHGFNVDQATNYPPDPNRVWQNNLHNLVMRFSPEVLPHSYRFLPNSIVRWMQLAGIGFDSARDLYRLIVGLLLFYSIYKYARLYCNYTGALIAMLSVTAIYPVSFEHYAGQLTDPLSHLSFVLAFIFLETEEFALLLSTLLIGSLAKETVLAMAGYYLLFCRKEKNHPLKAAVLCLAGTAVYFGARLFVLHGTMHYSQVSGMVLGHVWDNWHNLVWPEPFLLTAGALLPFLALGWKETPLSLRRQAVFLLPVLFISSLFFGWLSEARNFMPLVFVLAVAAGVYLTRQFTDTFRPEAARETDTQPQPEIPVAKTWSRRILVHMKTAPLKSWILCLAVVPALLLALYLIERSGITVHRRAPGTPPTEIGSVDRAGDSKGAETVSTAEILYILGWAADTAKGAPVDRVMVDVDGISAGAATLGVVRRDVENYYSRSDYFNCGWSFQMSASKLSPGEHTVTATASGPSGTAQLGSSRTITIRADTDGGRK
ncbi:MAG: hypothetical protein ABSB88_03485 [Bryobacteraceae bacterium]